MPTITADRLERIQNIILNRVLEDLPEARVIMDTQIILNAETDGVMNALRARSSLTTSRT